MNQKRSKYLRSLLRNATPGPWTSEPGWNNAGSPTRDLSIPGHIQGTTVEMKEADAVLITEMRTSMPELLDEIDTLEGRCNDSENACATYSLIIKRLHEKVNVLEASLRDLADGATNVQCLAAFLGEGTLECRVTPHAGVLLDFTCNACKASRLMSGLIQLVEAAWLCDVGEAWIKRSETLLGPINR